MYWLDILVFLTGICWGSFLALMSYRIPKGISIVKPRSFCDHCHKKIPFMYNIPIVSYLLLRGKCKECGQKINIRYLLVEIITGLLFLYSFEFLFLDYYSLIRAFILITAIIPGILIDIDERIIPDRFSIGLIIAGVTLSLFDPYMPWHTSVTGIILGGGLLYIVAAVYFRMTGTEGLGGGDIKLLAGIGALLGWQQVLMVILISSVMGSLFGIVLIVFFKQDRKAAIPFGPFIGIAAIAYHFLFEAGVI